MLNTKPIKKKLYDEYGNDIKQTQTDNNTNNVNNIPNENKISGHENSLSSRELVKMHNEKLSAQKSNEKLMQTYTKEREIEKIVQAQQENLMHGGHGAQGAQGAQGENDLLKQLANQLKSHQQAPPQVFFVDGNNKPNDILNNYNRQIQIEWNKDNNAYEIYFSGNIEGSFTNNDIIKSIIRGVNINKFIKKYFFIIAYNDETETQEFNFIDSVFTNDLELMIQVQNLVFDLSNNQELFDENMENQENLIIFNYQFIIYLFKKSNYLNCSDSTKIAKFYSTITYRFSALVLKQTMKIESDNLMLNKEMAKLLEIKTDIKQQLQSIKLHIKSKVYNGQPKQSSESVQSIESIGTTGKTEQTEQMTNSSNSDGSTDNTENSVNNSEQINITENNKNGVLTKIMSSLSSLDTSSDYDSDDNGYKEINDDVSTYMDKQVSVMSNSMSNKNNKNNKNFLVKYASATDPSYNKMSAVNNGKVYKIKL